MDFAPLTPTSQALMGITSAALSVAAFLPYIRDTMRGATQPQRASWLIWTVLSTIAFCAQMAEGAGLSLWFAGAQAGGTIIVFALSVQRGQGLFLTRPDERVLWIATIGLVVWFFTETAAYALAVTITISLLGGTLTVVKAYRDPASETMSCWLLGFMAACCALLSVGTWDPVLLAYPAYLFVLYGAIIAAMGLGRARAVQRAAG